jgi:hypothetical protein
MSIDSEIKTIQKFQGNSLTDNVANIENEIVGFNSACSKGYCENKGINLGLLDAALTIKKMSGQIDVVIHAAGILHALSFILEKNEVVESVSLGAGNTGKKFDLETNFRVAEFKFIDWKGGSESIRQNSIFKDFYELVEYETEKRKYLYVVGTKYPLKFFNSKRALKSVLAFQPTILEGIYNKYGGKFKIVSDYYNHSKNEVNICDVGQYIGRDV